MTRWARGSDSNRKKPLDGSSWKDLKKTVADPQSKFKHGRETNQVKRKKKHNSANFGKDCELKVKLHRPDDNKKPLSLVSELEEMKADLKISPEEANEMQIMVKKTERTEQRRLKRIDERQSKKTCYNCRETGHDISTCPKMSTSTDTGSGICFKCGSTEHTLYQCKVKVPGGGLPYAKCFICGEKGHLSRECPDNPRGLYPKGGCCRLCGSVEHYKKDCPDLQKQEGIEDIHLAMIGQGSSSVDAEVTLQTNISPIPVKKKTKVVKF